MTVDSFRSAYCEGRVVRELPSEFLDVTLGDVQALAKRGNIKARRCLKILGQGRFRQ